MQLTIIRKMPKYIITPASAIKEIISFLNQNLLTHVIAAKGMRE
ncbi:MAG: hypothetical protein O7G31_04015 [Calditrichaeota bacterium]|nr:hypothetical protein [Calditrichota bacterium]